MYQDRFVKELQLHRISTIEEANLYLREEYLSTINAKFARPPACQDDGHAILGEANLREILCFEEPRVMNRDFIMSYKRRLFQISPESRSCGGTFSRKGLRPRLGEKVTVRVRLDAQHSTSIPEARNFPARRYPQN